jgi:hypothetical protein
MSLSVTSLLLHSYDVPSSARSALEAARAVPAEQRRPHLEAAARALHREIDLDCADAKELVGL